MAGPIADEKRKRVVVTDFNFADLEQEAAAVAAAGAVMESFQCRDAEEARDALAGADVGVVQFAPIDAGAIEVMAPGGRLIRYGVGYDNIDLLAAAARGVEVAYVPDYCTDEVADHTATLVLSLVRRLPALDGGLRRGRWGVLATAPDIGAPRKLLVGFMGLGRIGRSTLSRLTPFGFKFAVNDPNIGDDDIRAMGAAPQDQAALLSDADVIVLHTPLTNGTRHIIDAAALARMKPGAIVVNTARGGLIDEHALAQALKSGRLAGAGLDVFENEPLEESSPLRSQPNAILTPHAAWYSDEALAKLQRLVADEITRALEGRPARCPVPVRSSAPRMQPAAPKAQE